MGKLNIAHHKSYHPYRRDNIERVKQDEEEARLKEAKEEGRMRLAVCYTAYSSFSGAQSLIFARTQKLALISSDSELA